MSTRDFRLLDRNAEPAAAGTGVVATWIWRPRRQQEGRLGDRYGTVLASEIKEKLRASQPPELPKGDSLLLTFARR